MEDSNKKEANEIVEMFMPHMYCYMGSGMLTNTYDKDVARSNAIQCAIKHVTKLLKLIPKQVHGWHEYVTNVIIIDNPDVPFYESVLIELKKM